MKIIVLYEHLGDIIACTPMVNYLKNNQNKIFWVINQKYSTILNDNPNINRVIPVSFYGQWLVLNKVINILGFKNINVINLHILGKYCIKTGLYSNPVALKEINYKNYYENGTILEIFSYYGVGVKLDQAPKIYLECPRSKIPFDNFIIIHTSSNEDNRNWTDKGWSELAKCIVENYNYKIIEVGLKKNISINSNLYIDYTGYKDLKLIYGLINYSQVFIGIDSGFAHIANALNKNSFIILGHYHLFKTYMPYNGFFKVNENDVVFRFNGNLKDLEFSSFKIKLMEKLNRYCV